MRNGLGYKLAGPSPRDARDILFKLRLLRNEVDHRIEQGADCGGHLTYVMGELESILKEFPA